MRKIKEVNGMDLKKQTAGFYISLLTVLTTVISIIFYLINCKTEYFANYGMNGWIVICLIIAAAIEVAYILGSNKKEMKKYFEIFPIIGGAVLMIAFVLFLNARVSSIATILSFQKNAQTMSDLSSAIAAMGCCFAAAVFNMIGAFFKVVK